MAKKLDIWMPLYLADYLADTMHLSTEQHGAYLLLLMAMWKRGGDLPDDDAQLSAIVRLPIAKWKQQRPLIGAFFMIRGGFWTQKRLSEELEGARNRSKTAADNGSRGGRPPKAKENPPDNPKETQTETQTEPEPNPHESSSQSQSQEAPSPSHSQPQEEHPPDKPATRAKRTQKVSLPSDFAISDRVKAWAAARGITGLERHFEHFVGKAKARAYAYADWDEALMGAIRENWLGGGGGSRQQQFDPKAANAKL